MRISELSRCSGVSAASIKYYAREGLLPAGQRTGYNQTDYTDDHVARLRLIRSLTGVGGLSVAATRAVLAAADEPATPLAEVLGVAQRAVPRTVGPSSPRSRERVADLVRSRGWQVHDDNPGIEQAAGVLESYTALGREDLLAVLDTYAAAAESIAAADLACVAAASRPRTRPDAGPGSEPGEHPGGDRDRAAETVVVGTVLGDALLAGLRRIAQEDAAVRRYGGSSPRP